MIMHRIAFKTFQQPGNSQGVLYQENGQQLELPCVYLMRNRKDPQVDTEPTIELL